MKFLGVSSLDTLWYASIGGISVRAAYNISLKAFDDWRRKMKIKEIKGDKGDKGR